MNKNTEVNKTSGQPVSHLTSEGAKMDSMCGS
jgi:hypothetical protein